MNCTFCKIIENRSLRHLCIRTNSATHLPISIPKAPVHVLIVPREHIGSLAEAGKDKRALLGHLLWAAAEIAREKGLANGYRIVVNTGEDGGQTVDHLHLHLLGGRHDDLAAGIKTREEVSQENEGPTCHDHEIEPRPSGPKVECSPVRFSLSPKTLSSCSVGPLFARSL